MNSQIRGVPVKSAKRLGEMLLQQGLLSQSRLQVALIEQQRTGLPLGEQLLQLGWLDVVTIRSVIAAQLGLSASAPALSEDDRLQAWLSYDLLWQIKVLPVGWDESAHELFCVAANPFDPQLSARLLQRLPAQSRLRVDFALQSEIEAALAGWHSNTGELTRLLAEIYAEPASGAETPERNFSVRLVDALIEEAAALGMSDIHFEPEQACLMVRGRLDGVLSEMCCLHLSYWPPVLVRLKVIGNMNIMETRAAQDGRCDYSFRGRSLDLRLASHPTECGENLVVRILDRVRGLLPLDTLFPDPALRQQLLKMQRRPSGLLLMVGPTGAGKTTTLYSLVAHINTPQINIMTLEDPVEYHLPGLRQTQVGEVSRLDFASGVRSILRQDPDVLLIGEIRDRETAEMAWRAAATGHQVYASLHGSSALSAISILLELGARSAVLAENLIGVVAQRLLRRLCPHCRQPDDAARFYRAIGCAHCRGTGYRGRVAIVEILQIDAGLALLLARGESGPDLLAYARRHGFSDLADAALELVRTGVTSLAEARRVVDLGEFDARAEVADELSLSQQ